LLIIMMMVTWLLLAVFRGRLHPIGGLGVALGITVLLFPVVQPWYLLWAIIRWRPGQPAPASGRRSSSSPWWSASSADGQRRPLRPVPDRRCHRGQLIIVALIVILTYTRLPWRPIQARAANRIASESSTHCRPPRPAANGSAGRLR